MHRKLLETMASVAIIEKAPSLPTYLYSIIFLRHPGVLESLLYSFQFVMLPGYPTAIDWAATSNGSAGDVNPTESPHKVLGAGPCARACS